MQFHKLFKNILFVLGLVAILILNSAAVTQAHEQLSTAADLQVDQPKDEGDWEKDMDLPDRAALTESLINDFGYSEKQANAFFEVSQRIQSAYKARSSQEELERIAKEYEAIAQTSSSAEKSILGYSISTQLLLTACPKGAEAKYDVKFGPHAGLFVYINANNELRFHKKIGFRAWPTYKTITHTSTTPGFYIAHFATGNKLRNHRVSCR